MEAELLMTAEVPLLAGVSTVAGGADAKTSFLCVFSTYVRPPECVHMHEAACVWVY